MEINDVVAEISSDIKNNFSPYRRQFIGYEAAAIVLGIVIGLFTGQFQFLAIFAIAIPLIVGFLIFFVILFWFPATVAK